MGLHEHFGVDPPAWRAWAAGRGGTYNPGQAQPWRSAELTTRCGPYNLTLDAAQSADGSPWTRLRTPFPVGSAHLRFRVRHKSVLNTSHRLDEPEVHFGEPDLDAAFSARATDEALFRALVTPTVGRTLLALRPSVFGSDHATRWRGRRFPDRWDHLWLVTERVVADAAELRSLVLAFEVMLFALRDRGLAGEIQRPQ